MDKKELGLIESIENDIDHAVATLKATQQCILTIYQSQNPPTPTYCDGYEKLIKIVSRIASEIEDGVATDEVNPETGTTWFKDLRDAVESHTCKPTPTTCSLAQAVLKFLEDELCGGHQLPTWSFPSRLELDNALRSHVCKQRATPAPACCDGLRTAVEKAVDYLQGKRSGETYEESDLINILHQALSAHPAGRDKPRNESALADAVERVIAGIKCADLPEHSIASILMSALAKYRGDA